MLTNSGLSTIHELDVVCTYCTSLLRTFVLLLHYKIDSSLHSFNLYDNYASTKIFITVVFAFSLATSYLSFR